MEISIKNLGPIKEGTINLDRNLTILTGPNNTGKSYITYLIHGITQHEKLSDFASFSNKITTLFRAAPILKSAIEQGEPVDLFSTVLEKIPEVSNLVTENAQNNLVKIFASSSVNPIIKLTLNDLGQHHIENPMKTFTVFGNDIYTTFVDGTVDKKLLQSDGFSNLNEGIYDKLAHILSLVTSSRLGVHLPRRTYFFPAERTAINLFAKHITSTKANITDELQANLIAGISTENLASQLKEQVKSEPKYPYAIRDYINFVNDFQKPDTEGPLASIALNMELALTNGKIQLDEFNQLMFTPSSSKAALELHLSSSLVKSLSYLILYLRYTAKKRDLVIIDEPELNLHPDLQIALAKAIAEMVNADLKVIISTHSDYLIKELNNLILLGELNKEDKHKPFVVEKGFAQNEILTREQVGAYFLHSGAGGGSIELINIEDDGLVVPTINDAIRRVDGLAEEVYMEMEG